ncbi:MAG: DUF4440 domain-containing protein [Luteitalea sp.]|nr:DUF4440 domain-containing protein [Luteitalea sp.]
MSIRALTAVALSMLILALPLHAQEASRPSDEGTAVRSVRTLLEEQVAAWNRGDLERFMAAYWRSPDLLFTSGAEVRRGWQATYERYRKRYGGDVETMGQLAFEDLEITMLGGDAAWVLGRWHLIRNSTESGGIFTLVLRHLDGEWRIVHDHTSVKG